jgi:xanthine permease XanP
MTAVYISPSLEAMHLGGLALMSGMTMFGGALEALLSRSMRRLRRGGDPSGGDRWTTAPCWQKVHSCRRTTWTVAAITL